MRKFARPSIIVFSAFALLMCVYGSGVFSRAGVLPIVRAQLGESFENVERHSTYDFKLKDISEYQLIPIQGPIRFEYRNQQSKSVFPNARFLALHVVQGRLTSATVDPLARPVTLDEAMKVAGDTLRVLESNGWKPHDQSKPSSVEAARKKLETKSANLEMSANVATLGLDGDWLQIQVRRMWGEEDKFVVAIDIQNGTIIHEQTRQQLTHRRIELSPVQRATQ